MAKIKERQKQKAKTFVGEELDSVIEGITKIQEGALGVLSDAQYKKDILGGIKKDLQTLRDRFEKAPQWLSAQWES